MRLWRENLDGPKYIIRICELLDLAHRLRSFQNSRTQELFGLSLEQSVLLCRLEAHYGQNTVTALATESGRTPHTITAMVNILEREGLVVRRRNRTADRRQVWVLLTAQGSSKIQAVQQAGPELIARLRAGSKDDLIEQKLDEALRPMRALLPD